MRAQDANNFHCPRWEELPGLSLYMDQVIIILEEAVSLFIEGDKGVTSTMINNYVKHKVIPAPEKKKYERQHLASLIVVTVMKRVLSMNEISELVRAMSDTFGIQKAYDIFCNMLEKEIKTTFGTGGKTPGPAAYKQGARGALEAGLTALMGKMYVQSYLERHSAKGEEPAEAEKLTDKA